MNKYEMTADMTEIDSNLVVEDWPTKMLRWSLKVRIHIFLSATRG